MKFLTGYESDADRAAHSKKCGFETVGDSLTVQDQAGENDVNVIMERYNKTGIFPAPTRLPSFGDFSHATDFRTALEIIGEAEECFASLPAKVRSRFDNDPATFVAFCDNPANQLELAELGLLEEKAAQRVREEAAKVKQQATSGQTREPRQRSASPGAANTRRNLPTEDDAAGGE